MDIALIAAKILGIYLIVSGLFLLFRGKTVPQLIRDLFDHPAVVYLAGALLIFLSSAFLIQYNVWDGTWHTLVTVLMWAVFAKGVMYILAPETLHRLVTKKMMELLNFYGIIALVAGVYLFFIA